LAITERSNLLSAIRSAIFAQQSSEIRLRTKEKASSCAPETESRLGFA
jgi:hypothetical protein